MGEFGDQSKNSYSLSAKYSRVQPMYIALLDREEHQAIHVRHLLETVGHTACIFHNGADLIRAIGRDTIDLFVLEWEAPKKSGLEVLRHIREVRRMHAPVIFLSHCSEEHHVTTALQAGADDYCTKPIKPGEFLARLQAVLRRSYPPKPPHNGPVRELHGHVFDERTLTVQWGQTAVALNLKEFKLAVFLFEHANRALSRERLMHEVWGHHNEDLSRTLDVHVSWLRRKLNLGKEGRFFSLQPIYGYGYRLIPSTPVPNPVANPFLK